MKTTLLTGAAVLAVLAPAKAQAPGGTAPAPVPPAAAEATAAVAAKAGDPVSVRLRNGDAIKAVLVAETADKVTIRHPALGEMTLDRSSVVSVVPLPPEEELAKRTATDDELRKILLGPASDADMDAPRPVDTVNPADDAAGVGKDGAAVDGGAGAAGAAPAGAGAAGEVPAPPAAEPSPWKFVIDANVNYVSAANKQLDFRVAAGAVYEVKDVEKWANTAEYFFKTVDGGTTDNNLLVTSVYDRRFESDPRVLWFAKGQFQWAPLEDYEQRASAWGGLGYEFFKKPVASLIGKIGAGYSYEFGNINQGYPQLYASLEWDWDITENQAIVGSYWITPDFADFTDFLMLARLEWTIKVQELPGLKLLGGVRWQYQSQVPTGDIQNDIRVYAGLRLEI
jgi:putative salt-induced outer membrane protein YdiY